MFCLCFKFRQECEAGSVEGDRSFGGSDWHWERAWLLVHVAGSKSRLLKWVSFHERSPPDRFHFSVSHRGYQADGVRSVQKEVDYGSFPRKVHSKDFGVGLVVPAVGFCVTIFNSSLGCRYFLTERFLIGF